MLHLLTFGILVVASPQDRFDGIDDYVRQAMATWEVPGLAIAVVDHGEVVLAKGYGVRVLGTESPVTPSTAFPIASCAKAFVTGSLAALIDDGELSWDDPVTKYLPELRFSDEWRTEHLTLRDLAAHRTGLQRCDLLTDHFQEPEDVLARVCFVPAVAEPRTRLTYSNAMFTVLGQVVAAVAEKPHQAFLHSRLLEPLGMSSTWMSGDEVPQDRVVHRHWRSDDGIVSRPIDTGMHSTVLDMTRWLRLHLGAGRFEDRQVLEDATVREMHALQVSVPIRWRQTENPYAAKFYGSGLGWFVQEYRGHKLVMHTGSWGAVTAMLPELQVGVVVLSNLDLESLPALLMFDVFDAYLLGPETWDPSKWSAAWLKNEPPGVAYRPRDRAREKLAAERRGDRPAARPLKELAGRYESPLHGAIEISVREETLLLSYGPHHTELSHWEADAYYARTPTDLTFDWLVTFGSETLTVHHVGWDADEADLTFTRKSDR
ncbi:MAG: serine hydrolase [Planctomycetota bacterium]